MKNEKEDRGEFRGLNELKVLKGRKRLEYIWNYYKIALGILAIAVYLFIYVLYRRATATEPYLYLGLVNVSAGETLTQELTEDFLAGQEDATGRSVVETYPDLLLTEITSDTDSSYVYASQMKILAAIDGEELDVVLLDKEAFDAFAQNGYLCNMEDFLSTQVPELSGMLADDLALNIEILEDNATDVMLDNSLTYEASTSEYPMALRVNDLPVFKEAGFSEDLYLAILVNTPRREAVADYLRYLAQ